MARPTRDGLRTSGFALLRVVAYVLLLRFTLPPVVGPVMKRLSTVPGFSNDMAAHRMAAPSLLVSDFLALVGVAIIIALLVLSEGSRDAVPLWRRAIRRSLLSDGRGFHARWFAGGLVTGFLLLSAIVGVALAAGAAHVAWTGQSAGAVLRHELVFVVAFLLVGLLEEVTSRGYVLRALTDAVGFWPAALFTSGLFAYAHYAEGDPLVGVIGVMEFAVFSCAAIRATGTLAFSIGFHAAWDFAQSAIFGVPDSSFTFAGALLHTTLGGPAWLTGGIVGPEASVLTLVAIPALTVLILWRGYRRSRSGTVDTAWRRQVAVARSQVALPD